MRRLQLDLNAGVEDQYNVITAKVRAHQQGFMLKATTLKGIALEIRDEIGLKKCTRAGYETFIFTDI